MHSTISIMNAKGGVGKSTLTLTLAETLAAVHSKRVLVVDSDAHSSVSTMLMRPDWVMAIQQQGRTIVDYFISLVLKSEAVNWTSFVSRGVSDVDDARTVDLMTGGGHLTLFEREVSKGDRETLLRKTVGACLREAQQVYDYVFVDSAPGLSVLTECWLREAAFYLSPTRPDYISTRGLAFLRKFRQRNPEMGFAELLGVIVNMKDTQSSEDDQYDQWLRQDPDNRCFTRPILRVTPLQSAAYFSPSDRSYWAKYPGQTGDQLRYLTDEFLHRVAGVQNGQRR
jgi:chromosome partitioning protein